MARLKQLAVAAVVVASLALVPAALAHKLSYAVAFSINKGRFMSSESAGDISINETDDFFGPTANFHGLEIPRRGPASSNIHLKGSSILTHDESSWERFGTGYGDPDGQGNIPVVSYDCKGHLAVPGKPPRILSGAGTARKQLHLHIQSTGGNPVIKGSTGHDGQPSDNHSCSWYDGTAAFSPASTYAQDMLTADIQIPLAELRGLKKGQAAKLQVSESDADYTPTSDCSSGGLSCTLNMHWKGVVNFRRTG